MALYNTTGSYKTHFSLSKIWRIREVKFPDKLPLITSGHYTRAVSVLISLDENGEIANWTTCTEGGFMGPSEKELRMLAERKREKEEKAAEYERIAEENAIKRKLREQQEDERYYKTTSIAREAVSAAYERNII